MRILSPFSNPSEVAPLIQAGADELYCGVVPGEWEKRFTFIGSVNLRHDRLANLPSFKELEEAVKIAGPHQVPVFVAFNAHFYSRAQCPAVLKQVEQALSAGAESLIISDPALITAVKEKFPDAHVSLSTAQPCFNSQSLRFFKRLGAERVVLPRHLSVQEITGLAREAKKLQIELECFVMNVICPFIDGLCTFQHIVEPSQQLAVQPLACRVAYDIEVTGSEKPEKKAVAGAHVRIWNDAYSSDCGLCALQSFAKAGVASVKIAGRAHSLEKKIADVAAVKKAVFLAKKIPPARFREECGKLYFDLFHKTCQCINCYYPSAGKWKQ
ncbi:MAG: U32 family peptidase [Candidatus Diapherotrites archaeon]|nr:U32 family peptidase [Candidatus Diapherotrites archaeon]